MLTCVCTHETTPQSDWHVHPSKTFHLPFVSTPIPSSSSRKPPITFLSPQFSLHFLVWYPWSHIVCTNCCLASSPAWLFQALSRSFHVSVGASLVAQTAKNLPAMQVTQVQSLGWEVPLGKEMATHSNILAWRLPWTEESGGLQSIQSKRVRHDWVTNTYLLPCINSSFLSYY